MIHTASVYNTTLKIIISSAGASILLSIIMLFQDNVINNDGVTYLVTAEHIKSGDWLQALQVYNWPFYPWLIAVFSVATTLSLEWSAYVLNTLLVCITVVAFILIAKEVENNNVFMIISAIVILVYPVLNDYRSFVIREHGYLGFYLLSIYFFILFIRNKDWRFALLWSVSMVIAALFRLEGIIFLLLMPLVLFLEKTEGFAVNLKSYMKANAVLVVLILVSSILILFTDLADAILASRLGDPIKIIGHLFNTHVAEVSQKALNMERYVLNKYSAKYSTLIIYGSFVLILLLQIVKTLTPINTVLVGLSVYKKRILKNNMLSYLWLWVVIINIMILSIFILRNHFLTGRFPLGLSLVLMLAIPFFIERIYRYIKTHGLNLWQKSVAGILAIVLLLFVLDGIVITGPKKDYIKQAGQWYASNVGYSENYFSNSSIFSYYAGQITESRSHTDYISENLILLFQSQKWKKLDYLVIKIPRKDKKLRKYIEKYMVPAPIKEFSSKRGDVIRIYKLG